MRLKIRSSVSKQMYKIGITEWEAIFKICRQKMMVISAIVELSRVTRFKNLFLSYFFLFFMNVLTRTDTLTIRKAVVIKFMTADTNTHII